VAFERVRDFSCLLSLSLVTKKATQTKLSTNTETDHSATSVEDRH